ncbi:MAG: hypothetical protein A3J24_03435 [Deltaproteobacteria bacterium RIFCSPLOWO2_02_FULL_53_8]|nr:MAG: hypothetical protein A3J24_03435 [Deltaproteobacteria bacterium RIFCSPLOWO2_02_FULL_53_8]
MTAYGRAIGCAGGKEYMRAVKSLLRMRSMDIYVKEALIYYEFRYDKNIRIQIFEKLGKL